MKRITIILAAILVSSLCFAKDKALVKNVPDSLVAKEFSNEYLDTVKLRMYSTINNYSMIGVNYGVALTAMTFNPAHQQIRSMEPGYMSVMFVHYEKMFDYMPYFGIKAGIAYGKEGYRFKPNKETGAIFNFSIERSNQIKMSVVEIPFLAEVHYDTRLFKLFADFGVYGGYRLNVERFGPRVEEEYRTKFYPTDHQWDYGMQGGAGFGFVLEPVEFHFGALVRYGWSSLFDPNSTYASTSQYAIYNRYYYRYAYPFDIMITGGVYLNLTKRHGRTTAELKKAAKDFVYGTTEQ